MLCLFCVQGNNIRGPAAESLGRMLRENAKLTLYVCCTRGDQKVLQFSMMYKWHRQNNYIIFQCNLRVHQYTFHICQKVLLFQSNRIPGAGCRDTALWPATVHHHQKTLFREGAASDVVIGRSRWVSGRVSKVGETAAQTRCP